MDTPLNLFGDLSSTATSARTGWVGWRNLESLLGPDPRTAGCGPVNRPAWLAPLGRRRAEGRAAAWKEREVIGKVTVEAMTGSPPLPFSPASPAISGNSDPPGRFPRERPGADSDLLRVRAGAGSCAKLGCHGPRVSRAVPGALVPLAHGGAGGDSWPEKLRRVTSSPTWAPMRARGLRQRGR